MPTEAEYEAMLSQAQNHQVAGRAEEAKAVCRDAMRQAEAARDDAFVHLFSGCLAYLDGDRQHSLGEAAEAAGLAPDSPLVNTELGSALIDADREEEGLEACEKALRLRPGYAPALRVRGAALASLGRYEEALAAYDEALALAPQDGTCFRRQAIALLNLGRDEEALASARKAVELRPDDLYADVALAHALIGLGTFGEAREHLDKAAAAMPGDWLLRNALGDLLLREGDASGALECYETALRARPGNVFLRTSRAIALGNLGEKEEAAKELEAVLRERPDHEPAKYWLVRFAGPERAQKLAQEHLEEQRRKEQEERDRQIKLDAWRRLSSRTAHRVDNQLFAAKGALRALKAEPGRERSEEVSDIEACLDRIGRICTEFRRFSSDQRPKPRPTDPGLLVQDAARRFGKSAEEIEVQARVPALMPECRWDPQQIEQAVTELIENAIRHTPKGKAVDVAAEQLERSGRQYVRLTVRNDGEGIEARYKDRVFEPFFSLRPGGTGLGLAIVRQIINNHKGSIRETGEPGKFARFEIELLARPFEEGSDEGPGD